MLRKEGFVNLFELFHQLALGLPKLPLDNETVATEKEVEALRAQLQMAIDNNCNAHSKQDGCDSAEALALLDRLDSAFAHLDPEFQTRLRVSFDFHVVCDFLESVHLWDGKDHLVKMDAFAVFTFKKWGAGPALETDIPRDFDSALDFVRDLNNRWQFIPRPLIGKLKVGLWQRIFNLVEREPDRKAIFELMKNYDGYFVLLSESDLEAPMNDLRFYRSQLSVTHDGKPPSTIENILDCFNKAFPQGKGSATWEEVESRVGYSRRSIQRALQGARKI